MLQGKTINNSAQIQRFYGSLKSDEPMQNLQPFDILLEFDTETGMLLVLLSQNGLLQPIRIDLNSNYNTGIFKF